MARGLTGAIATAVGSDTFRFVLTAELVTNTTTYRYGSAPSDITWNSNTFTGNTLAGISDIQNSFSLSGDTSSFILKYLDSSLLSLFSSNTIGSIMATIRLHPVDSDGNLISTTTAVNLFYGAVTNVTVELSSTGEYVSVTLSSDISDLGSAQPSRLKFDGNYVYNIKGLVDDYSFKFYE